MIDRTLPIPAYQQVADHLHTRITEGEFDETRILPPVKALALQYKVSRTTVQLASKQLADDGIVITYPGSCVRLPGDEKPHPRLIDELTEHVEQLSKKTADLTEIVEALILQSSTLRKRVRTLEDANRNQRP